MRQDNFLETIAGVGPLTASALAASIGNPQAFRDGLELAAWLGLVSRQYSPGGKPRLLGISKRGDTALRTIRCRPDIGVEDGSPKRKIGDVQCRRRDGRLREQGMNLATVVGVMYEKMRQYQLMRQSLWFSGHTDVVEVPTGIATHDTANNTDKPIILG